MRIVSLVWAIVSRFFYSRYHTRLYTQKDIMMRTIEKHCNWHCPFFLKINYLYQHHSWVFGMGHCCCSRQTFEMKWLSKIFWSKTGVLFILGVKWMSNKNKEDLAHCWIWEVEENTRDCVIWSTLSMMRVWRWQSLSIWLSGSSYHIYP